MLRLGEIVKTWENMEILGKMQFWRQESMAHGDRMIELCGAATIVPPNIILSLSHICHGHISSIGFALFLFRFVGRWI